MPMLLTGNNSTQYKSVFRYLSMVKVSPEEIGKERGKPLQPSWALGSEKQELAQVHVGMGEKVCREGSSLPTQSWGCH